MRGDLLPSGPAHEVQADHLITAERRFPTCPQADQQAGDDRAIRLDLDPVAMRAQQMAAAQHMLEEPEEQFNRPPMFIDIRKHFGRNVEQIRGDPQHAVARRARGAPLATAAFGVGRGLDQEHADFVVRGGKGDILVFTQSSRSG